MAIKYNTINDVDFSVAIGGAPAADGDTINVNKHSTRFNTGLSLATYKALKIQVHPQSKCDFLSPLVCKADEVIYNGSGNTFPLKSSSSTGEIDKIVIAPARPSVAVEISDCVVADGIYVLGGTVTIRDTVNTTGDVEIAAGSLENIYHATHKIDGVLRCMGGITRHNRRADAIAVGGSALVMLEEVNATQGNAEQTGGTLMVSDSGTVAQYIGRAGVIDFTNLSRPMTFTDWVEYPGLTIRLRRSTPTITKTSSAAPYGPAKVEYID